MKGACRPGARAQQQAQQDWERKRQYQVERQQQMQQGEKQRYRMNAAEDGQDEEETAGSLTRAVEDSIEMSRRQQQQREALYRIQEEGGGTVRGATASSRIICADTYAFGHP